MFPTSTFVTLSFTHAPNFEFISSRDTYENIGLTVVLELACKQKSVIFSESVNTILIFKSAGSILGGVFLEVLSYRMTYLSYAALPAVTAILFTCAMVFKR